jgi:hypothetical protein
MTPEEIANIYGVSPTEHQRVMYCTKTDDCVPASRKRIWTRREIYSELWNWFAFFFWIGIVIYAVAQNAIDNAALMAAK